MAATAKVYASIDAVLSSSLDLGVAEYHQRANLTPTEFSNGSGANAINKVWSDQRTLTASGTELLDVAGGLTDALGQTVTFTGIKCIHIKASTNNTNNVQVGGATHSAMANIFASTTDIAVIKPGGQWLIMDPSAAGYAVGAGTADLLRVDNSAGSTSVTYDITILGIG